MPAEVKSIHHNKIKTKGSGGILMLIKGLIRKRQQ